MNYIVLNDEDFYKDISLPRFKEVLKNGNRRVDGIFGTVTKELLEQSLSNDGGGDIFSENEWLCGDRGILFVVLRVPQDILYDQTGKSLEKCFGLFNPESFWLELGSFRIKDKENTYEYFFIAYNKNQLEFKIFFDDEIIFIQKEAIVDYLCRKIEQKIL